MIGAMSSSLSLAQRTASKARATMEDMSRQIATGQKVSSVKDNGAAWTQAAALRSQKAQNEAREGVLANLDYVVAAQTVVDDTTREHYDRLVNLLVAAIPHTAGSSARAALAAEWQEVQASIATVRAPTGAIVSGVASQGGSDAGIRGPLNDPLFSGQFVWTLLGTGVQDWSWGVSDPMGTGTTQNSVNLLTASTSQLQGALSNVRYFRDTHLANHNRRNDEAWLQSVRSYVAADNDRLDTAISALTDADMGQASTALRESQTRQQLALNTIQQAISAYGNFASGLLGNVQRTQRGLLA